MPKDYTSRYDIERLQLFRDCIERLNVAGGAAIELGCNDGTMTPFLTQRFADVVAIDIDPDNIAAARRKLGDERVTWLQHDLDQPFPASFERRFDVAVAMEVIEHLKAPDEFLRGIRRILRKSGVLLLSTPNLWSPEGVMGRFWAWRAGEKYNAWDPTHKKLFDSREILGLLKNNGFHPEKVIGYHYATPTVPLLGRSLTPPITSSARWPLNRLGFNIIIEAVEQA